MVDIVRPSELDAATAVVSSDAILIDTGLVLQKATAAQIVDAGRPNASEAEALAGTDNFLRMSPLRVKQAIDGSDIAADAAAALAAAEAALALVSGAYPSRADFIAATIPAPVVSWTVIHEARALDYVRDAAGTAIESANGVKGSPAGESTVLHWGASPLADPADNHAAFSAALASPFSRIVVPRMPTQYFIGGQLLVTGTSKTLAGDGLSRASLSFADTFSGPAIVFAPATRTDNVLQGNNGIENLNLDGVGSDRAGRWAIEIVKQEAFTLRNMRWGGFSYGVRYAGGQLSNFSDFYGFGSGRTAGTQLSDSCHLCVESEPNTSGTKPAYTLNISNFNITGSSAKNIQDIIRLGQADGLNISNGYVAYGFGSLLKVDPLAGESVVAVQIANTYFDGVNTSTGTESGLYVPANTTGANISMEFTNCFLGNYTGRCINADTNNVIRSLVFNGCNLSSAAIAIGGVRGDANARIQFKGTTLRNSAGGLKVIGARTLDVDATFVDITDAAGALQISGTISRKKIAANFIGCTLNRADTSTTTTLADYEWIENGTFTPVISIGGVNLAGASHSAQTGQYTKIQNRVYFDVNVAITSKEAKTGDVRVTGLPFARGGTVNPQLVCRPSSGSALTTGVTMCPGDILAAGASVRLNKLSTNGSTPLTDVDIQATFSVLVSGSYTV